MFESTGQVRRCEELRATAKKSAAPRKTQCEGMWPRRACCLDQGVAWPDVFVRAKLFTSAKQ